MIQHTNECTLRDAEDATQAADYDRGGRFTRPATPTEILLLTAFGYAVPPALDTHVDHLTPGARRREWPNLKLATVEEEPTP